ncbi:hypothetical protein GCM10022221_43120 [Actinocorallia aurea]
MRQRTGRVLLALGLAGAAALVSVPAPAAAAGWVDDLCTRAQKQTSQLNEANFAAAGGSITNVDYADFEAFKESKPQAQPLTIGSYITYEDEARTQPKQVRCKTKTSDHIKTMYGANAAGAEQDCKVINAGTVDEVFASLTAEEQASLAYPRTRVVIGFDWPAFTGADWLWDFPAAFKGWDGKLNIPSRNLNVPWAWAIFPENFRGQHYCTLIAPQYLKRLILGQAQV